MSSSVLGNIVFTPCREMGLIRTNITNTESFKLRYTEVWTPLIVLAELSVSLDVQNVSLQVSRAKCYCRENQLGQA